VATSLCDRRPRVDVESRHLPATSLKAARAKRTALRAALGAGNDPAAERRAERANSANSFETIAREWLAKQPFAPKTLQKAVWTFEDLLFPYLGPRPVSALTPPELLEVFRRLGGAASTRPRIGPSNE